MREASGDLAQELLVVEDGEVVDECVVLVELRHLLRVEIDIAGAEQHGQEVGLGGG